MMNDIRSFVGVHWTQARPLLSWSARGRPPKFAHGRPFTLMSVHERPRTSVSTKFDDWTLFMNPHGRP